MPYWVGTAGQANWYYGATDISDIFADDEEGQSDDEYDQIIVICEEPYVGSTVSKKYYRNSAKNKYYEIS